MKSYDLIFICLILLIAIPMVSARDRVSIYIDANSWIEDDGINNISRFTISLYPKDEDRNVDIEDGKEFRFENMSSVNNDTVIIRFDSSITCTDSDVINNITTICQTRTEELESARKSVELNKQTCDTNLATCNTERTTFKEKSDKYDSLETSYNTCISDKNTCMSVRDECKKSKDNMIWYILVAGGVGILIGSYVINIKDIFKGGKKSSEMKETSQSIQGEF